nr:hypothetical protein [Paracoccus sp. (in: a-proteobacteria)]
RLAGTPDPAQQAVTGPAASLGPGLLSRLRGTQTAPPQPEMESELVEAEPRFDDSPALEAEVLNARISDAIRSRSEPVRDVPAEDAPAPRSVLSAVTARLAGRSQPPDTAEDPGSIMPPMRRP